VRELATITKIDAGYVSRVLALLDSEALIRASVADASRALTGLRSFAGGRAMRRSSREEARPIS
jgi:hypothetical protein